MKILGLLRHAKSEEGQRSCRDFDRELNAKGRRAAEVMGRHIGERAPRFDRVIASPALRVQETLGLVLEAMGAAAPAQRDADKRIYLATSQTLAEVAADRGGDAAALLLAGHNPGLEDLVLDLVANDGTSPLRAIVEEKYPTGAFALLEFDIGDWGELPGAKGRLVALTRPRDLDSTLGPEFAD